MQTLVHEKENKESDGVDDQDENTDDLCGESDYRNEPLPCGGKKITNQTTKKASLTLMTLLNACSSPRPTSPDRRLKSMNTENSGI